MRSQFLSDRPAQNSTPSGAPDAMLGAESLEKRLKSSDADEDAGTGGSVDVADVVSSGAGSLALARRTLTRQELRWPAWWCQRSNRRGISPLQ